MENAHPPLTRWQKRQIQVYLYFRNRPMSVAGLIWFNRRLYALLVSAAVITVGGVYLAGEHQFATFFAVAYGSFFFRDLAYYRRSRIVWPVISRMLAWEKVEQLASASGIEA